ncbi:MAG: hypothetical protein ACK4FF_10835 [Limnobacter sp.]|uniref:hypothetical protein n=1 Tax=Limnobacter sp. TaxID=2003368 RepID=UPI00391C8034
MLPALSPTHANTASAPDAASSTHSFDSRDYQTISSFGQLAKLYLNETWRVSASPRGNAHVWLTLRELMDGLALERFLIKGSAAWRTPSTYAAGQSDLDLQLTAPISEFENQGQALIDRIKLWMNTRYTAREPGLVQFKGQANPWINRSQFWQTPKGPGLLISVGKKMSGSQVIDLVFNSRGDQVSFDSLSASRVLAIDLVARTAVTQDVCHPQLVTWLRNHQLHWFARDINQGLGRLSYRASKESPITLLQDDLWSHFLSKASQEEIGQMLIRTWADLGERQMTGPGLNPGVLSRQARAPMPEAQRMAQWGVFRDMVQALNMAISQSNEADKQLSDLRLLEIVVLGWTKMDSLAEIAAIDHHADSVTADQLLTRWLNACRCSSELRDTLPSCVNSWEGLRQSITQHGQALLNIQTLNMAQLDCALKSSEGLDQVPVRELNAVLGEAFARLADSEPSESSSPLAKHALNWLRGCPVGTLAVLIHRMPANRLSSPRQQECVAITDQLKLVMLMRSEALASIHDNLTQIRLPKHCLSEVIQILNSQHRSTEETLTATQGQPLWVQALGLITLWQRQLSSLGQSEWSRDLSAQCVARSIDVAHALQKGSIPPLIAEVAQIKGDCLHIVQPGSGQFELRVTTDKVQAKASPHVFEFDPNGGWVDDCQKKGKQPTKRVFWPDTGLLFLDGASQDGLSSGTLKIPVNAMIESHKGLIRLGVDVLASFGVQLNLSGCSIKASGEFLDKNIQANTDSASALEGMQSGRIALHDAREDSPVKWLVVDGKPVKMIIKRSKDCKLWLFNADLTKTPESTPSSQRGWLNAWRVWPTQPMRLMTGFLTRHSPSIRCQVECEITLDTTTMQFGPQCTIRANQLGLTYTWQGALSLPEPIPKHIVPRPPMSEGSGPDAPPTPEQLPVPIQAIGSYLLLCKLAGAEHLNCTGPAHQLNEKDCPWPEFGFFTLSSDNNACHLEGYTWTNQRIWGWQTVGLYVADWVHMHYLVGSFMLLPQRAVTKVGALRNLGLHTAPDSVLLNRADRKALRPHGLCKTRSTSELVEKPWDTSQCVLYFCGLGFVISHMAPKVPHLFQSLNTVEYWNLRSSMHAQEVYHVLFKQPNGYPDAMIRLPSKMGKAYAHEMWDTNGLHVCLTIQNGSQPFALIELPSGLTYRGQFFEQDGLFTPCGRASLSHGNHQVSLEFEKDNRLKSVSGKSPGTCALLKSHSKTHGPIGTLDDVLHALRQQPTKWANIASRYLPYDHVVGRNIDTCKQVARACLFQEVREVTEMK